MSHLDLCGLQIQLPWIGTLNANGRLDSVLVLNTLPVLQIRGGNWDLR